MCLLGEINFPSIESYEVMRRPGTPARNILAAIPALLIASCDLHIEAKYLVV